MSRDIYPTLKKSRHEFAVADFQVSILENRLKGSVRFKDKMKEVGLYPLKPWAITIFQINMGKMCNQTCSHCHVDAGPDRDEIMTRETMLKCIEAIKMDPFKTIDLTGGAPEHNPDFRWFVEQLRSNFPGIEIIVRSNLTIINESEQYFDLPDFYAKHHLTIVSSLPCYTEDNVDKQRGRGVYERSIDALKKLNTIGYGQADNDLKLHLVYNPGGAELPGSQMQLQADYKKELAERHGIVFNNLYTITNMPINRFLNYLVINDKYEYYMGKLIDSFNPSAAMTVMCRDTLSVDWQGYIYDCDFNQQLDMAVEGSASQHIKNFNFKKLSEREIVLGQHCYGCTAGEGSSCQGALDLG
ncbi:MAG: arsenosugar biosynthesis radical SAM protein ArsS [Bacteroidales bacterium]|nr:arsenosugar biosynthesis radical SAM protein ArsS [Bacteroidales bacterium]MCF8404856.1 arsenosugar biosynthesis radical SAM protein ArsS [Bacteroidales bacterium]